MPEIWRSVPGYEGYYEVSDRGNVRSLDRYVARRDGTWRFIRGQSRTPTVSPDGHLRVSPSKDNVPELRAVHRLVLEAFIGPCPDGMECCHRDDNKLNNNLSNLRWDTHRANLEDYARNFGFSPFLTGARVSFCRHGHEYTSQNTYEIKTPKGEVRRECRICRAAKARAWYAKKRKLAK